MSTILKDHSHKHSYYGQEPQTVRARTVQLPQEQDTVKILSMWQNHSQDEHPRIAKVTIVGVSGNSSVTYNIDEIREVLREWDAWQAELAGEFSNETPLPDEVVKRLKSNPRTARSVQ